MWSGALTTPSLHLLDHARGAVVAHAQPALDHGTQDQKEKINPDEILQDLVEQNAFEARGSEYIDAKSGVSARLSVSAYENLKSTAERRRIINNEKETNLRLSDLYGVIPSITGKIELVYEGEQEGPLKVAHVLIGKAIKTVFEQYFPSPEKAKKSKNGNPYQSIINWFGNDNSLDLVKDISDTEYEKLLKQIPGLADLTKKYFPNDNGKAPDRSSRSARRALSSSITVRP